MWAGKSWKAKALTLSNAATGARTLKWSLVTHKSNGGPDSLIKALLLAGGSAKPHPSFLVLVFLWKAVTMALVAPLYITLSRQAFLALSPTPNWTYTLLSGEWAVCRGH